MKSLTRKRFSAGQVIGILLAVFLWSAGSAYAQVTIPNTFSPGTTISSSQVNDNFTALKNAVDANTTAIGGMPGLNVNAEGGVGVPLSATAATVTSLTINAPTDGYVIVHYTGLGQIGHTNGTRDAIRLEITMNATASISNTYSFVSWQLPAALPSGGIDFYYSPMSTQRVFEVTSGLNAFYVRADLIGGGTTGSLYYNQITGLFVPNLVGTPAGY